MELYKDIEKMYDKEKNKRLVILREVFCFLLNPQITSKDIQGFLYNAPGL